MYSNRKYCRWRSKAIRYRTRIIIERLSKTVYSCTRARTRSTVPFVLTAEFDWKRFKQLTRSRWPKAPLTFCNSTTTTRYFSNTFLRLYTNTVRSERSTEHVSRFLLRVSRSNFRFLRATTRWSRVFHIRPTRTLSADVFARRVLTARNTPVVHRSWSAASVSERKRTGRTARRGFPVVSRPVRGSPIRSKDRRVGWLDGINYVT